MASSNVPICKTQVKIAVRLTLLGVNEGGGRNGVGVRVGVAPLSALKPSALHVGKLWSCKL